MNDFAALFLFFVQVPGAIIALYWAATARANRLLFFSAGVLCLSGWPRRFSWLLGKDLPSSITDLVLPLFFGSALLALLWFLRRER